MPRSPLAVTTDRRTLLDINHPIFIGIASAAGASFLSWIGSGIWHKATWAATVLETSERVASALVSIESKVANVEDQIRTAIAPVRGEVSEIRRGFDGLLDDIAFVKASIERIEERMDDVERSHGAEITQLRERVARLESAYEMLKEEVDSLRDARHEHSSQIRELITKCEFTHGRANLSGGSGD